MSSIAYADGAFPSAFYFENTLKQIPLADNYFADKVYKITNENIVKYALKAASLISDIEKAVYIHSSPEIYSIGLVGDETLSYTHKNNLDLLIYSAFRFFGISSFDDLYDIITPEEIVYNNYSKLINDYIVTVKTPNIIHKIDLQHGLGVGLPTKDIVAGFLGYLHKIILDTADFLSETYNTQKLIISGTISGDLYLNTLLAKKYTVIVYPEDKHVSIYGALLKLPLMSYEAVSNYIPQVVEHIKYTGFAEVDISTIKQPIKKLELVTQAKQGQRYIIPTEWYSDYFEGNPNDWFGTFLHRLKPTNTWHKVICCNLTHNPALYKIAIDSNTSDNKVILSYEI